jgi:hypothetical protein
MLFQLIVGETLLQDFWDGYLFPVCYYVLNKNKIKTITADHVLF